MQNEMLSIGMEVLYHGKRFNEMSGKLVCIDKIFPEENQAVCSFNGEGYILSMSNLSRPRGTDTWNGRRNFSDSRRSDGKVQED